MKALHVLIFSHTFCYAHVLRCNNVMMAMEIQRNPSLGLDTNPELVGRVRVLVVGDAGIHEYVHYGHVSNSIMPCMITFWTWLS